MELIIGILVVGGVLAVYWFIESMVGAASEAATEALARPVESALARASLAKVARELAIPHQFRLRAPVAEVQRTLETLPGLPDQPPSTCFAPYYVHKDRGRILFGIGRDTIANHYAIELLYRPEPWGAGGELVFRRWPDDAHEDTEYHRDLVETVLGELRRLDPGMQVRRPEVPA